MDVGVRLGVAGFDHRGDVDPDRIREAGKLVGEADVDIAVGRLRQLGQLGSLGRAEIPDPVWLGQIIAGVEGEG